MPCIRCGKELPDHTRFCKFCGADQTPAQPAQTQPAAPAQPAAPVAPAQTQPAAPKKSKKGLVIALVACALVLALGVTAFFLHRAGILFPKKDGGSDSDTSETAAAQTGDAVVTVDGVAYDAAAFGYYYMWAFQKEADEAYRIQSQLGISLPDAFDNTKSPDEQTTTDDQGKTITFHEKITADAVRMIARDRYYLNLAKEKGVTLTDEDRAKIDGEIGQLTAKAEEGGFSASHYIELLFGKNVTEERLRTLQADAYLAERYRRSVLEAQNDSITDAQINEEYRKNPTDYQQVDVRLFALEIGSADSSEGEAAAPASSAEEALLREMLEKITDEQSFIELAREYCAEEDKETYEEDTATLLRGVTKSAVSQNIDADFAEWLFSDERVPGDKNLVATDDTVYVVYIINPAYRNEQPLVTVRHILISYDSVAAELGETKNAEGVETETYTAGDGTELTNEGTGYSIEVAKQTYSKALDVFNEFNEGQRTEEAFAGLAEAYSDDTGSVGENGQTSGGLYENVQKGQMVEEFDAWIYDDARRPGDVDMVKTTYGWHVMYFISRQDEPAYKTAIRSKLAEAQAEESEAADKTAIEALEVQTDEEKLAAAAAEMLELVKKRYGNSDQSADEN